jgi:segregation and condensation protein B
MTTGPFSTKRIVEAALLAADEPLTLDALRRLFEPDPGADILASVLADLQQEWRGKAVELVCTASGWRFRTRAEIQPWLDRLRAQRAPSSRTASRSRAATSRRSAA